MLDAKMLFSQQFTPVHGPYMGQVTFALNSKLDAVFAQDKRRVRPTTLSVFIQSVRI